MVVLLALAAFWLGACPFSLWVGRWFLGKDIRDYADGNPGAANVFRAGGRKSGFLALVLDIAKGMPLVFLAHAFFGLAEPLAMLVGICAIAGHSFSPLLRLRGGKAIAVTFGVLMALPQHEVLFTFAAFMLLGFFFIENNAWIVMLGPVGSLAYLAVTGMDFWYSLFMMGVLMLLVIKHFNELKTIPRPKVRVIAWLQSRRRVI
ncbi:MAG TPA: glycerol-3-phosphate acyltransferase [Dehalococcoidia bacterium]|nr:glycerol-3-phosphate acyltransferase [Dehalococcoidia bacterium]